MADDGRCADGIGITSPNTAMIVGTRHRRGDGSRDATGERGVLILMPKYRYASFGVFLRFSFVRCLKPQSGCSVVCSLHTSLP